MHCVGMKFATRLAGAADVPSMHRLRTRVRENRLTSPHRVSELSYLPHVRTGSTWVAETLDGLVGFAAVNAAEQSVWALFVDPDAEGHGIGQALHQRMLIWAHEQGVEQLTLSTDQGTRAALFYLRAGWTEAGTASNGEAVFSIALKSQKSAFQPYRTSRPHV
jgi:GNAT superfamily N-acetyltransferase